MPVTKLLRTTIQHFKAKKWERNNSNFLVIFNWHQVAPAFDTSCHHEYTWTQLDNFEKEIAYLTSEFQILPLHEAISRFNRGCLQGRCASLTFDDGDASMAHYVWPLLRRLNLPATFFINSSYLDGNHSYWFPILSYFSANKDVCRQVKFPFELQEKGLQLRRTSDVNFYNEVRSQIEQFASFIPDLGARLISTEWLSGLDGEQFAIGAHGHEHQRFSMMPTVWQQNDLRENVRILSQFRAYRPVFAIPFGRTWDWSENTIRIAHNEGLDVVLADGGLNVAPGEFYRRIPSDRSKLQPLIVAAKAKECG